MSKKTLSIFLIFSLLTIQLYSYSPHSVFAVSLSYDNESQTEFLVDEQTGDSTTNIENADSFIVKYKDETVMQKVGSLIRGNFIESSVQHAYEKALSETAPSKIEVALEKEKALMPDVEPEQIKKEPIQSENTVEAWKDGYSIIKLCEKVNPDAFIEEFSERMDNIEYIQPNYLLDFFDADTYEMNVDVDEQFNPVSVDDEEEISDVDGTEDTDPDATSEPEETEAPEDDISAGLYTFDRYLDMEATWNTATGNGVTVAVIDSGVDITHPWFSSKIRDAWDTINDCALTYSADNAIDYRHGTHVTGIIASSAPDAEIMPIRTFTSGQAYTTDIIEAITYAEENGADIVNCSFGCTDNNPALREAMENSDMVFVCAAGNNRMDLDETPIYPACFGLDNIISVTSLNEDLGLSYYSNYSTGKVDIAAWGRDIESTWPDGETAVMNGTSMAAAFVSAGAAMAKELEVEDIKTYIKSTADKLSNLQSTVSGGNKISYYRLVNNITTNGYVEVNPADDFDVHGYQSTPSESWELFCSLDNVQVACGDGFTLALKENGTVWGWGDNYYGIFNTDTSQMLNTPVQITGLTNIVQISAGSGHAVALKSDGTVYTWGTNTYGVLGDGTTVSYKFPPAMISGLSNVSQISAKNTHNLLLKEDGTVLGWGRSTYGQLGTNTDSVLSPSSCSFPGNISKIEAGSNISVAITQAGDVWLCGYNYFGQLGLGDASTRYTPVQVTNMTNCIDVTSAWQQIYLLKSDNTVWATGLNNYGQLGLGDTTNRNTFTKITTLDNIVDFYGGMDFFIALDDEGIVYATGRNQYGQLGNGTQTDSDIPVAITGLPFITQVAAGQTFAFALTDTTQIWGWGDNDYYQLADGSYEMRGTPYKLNNFNAQKIDAGYNHTIALKSDGTVWTWGSNTYGQLGTGNTVDSSVPIQVLGLSNIVDIASGSYHCIAVNSSGTVYTWGRNTYGQLGDGTTTNSPSPVQMSNVPTNVNKVGAGYYTSFVITQSGNVYGCGYSNYGQAGIASSTYNSSLQQISSLSNVTKIDGGAQFTIALKSDGSVWALGRNNFGQIGNNSSSSSTYSTPTQVSYLINVSDISAGLEHAIAVNSSGSVYTWGRNNYGQLGLGTTGTNAFSPQLVTSIVPSNYSMTIKVAAGRYSSAAVNDKYTIRAWGYNEYLQGGSNSNSYNDTPVTISNNNIWYTDIAAGAYHNFVLSTSGQVYAWGDNSSGQLGDDRHTMRLVPIPVQGQVNDVQGNDNTDAHEIFANHTVTSSIDGVNDMDCYMFRPKYNGTYTFTLTSGFEITVKLGNTYINNISNGVQMSVENEYYISVVNRNIGYDETSEYTLRVNGIPEKTLTVNPSGSFNVINSVTNMNNISDAIFELTYNPAKIQVSDLVAVTYENELTTGTVNGYPVEIISIGNGLIKYRYTREYENVTFSGIVNIVRFTTLESGETVIALNIY